MSEILLAAALDDLTKSDDAGIARLREMGYCVYCDCAALVAAEVTHADDCPIVVARNLISLTEKGDLDQ